MRRLLWFILIAKGLMTGLALLTFAVLGGYQMIDRARNDLARRCADAAVETDVQLQCASMENYPACAAWVRRLANWSNHYWICKGDRP